VWRQVWETEYRDASYDRVRWVEETAEREERSTVWRQVVETQEREQRRTVLRPVQQTVSQTQYVPVQEPVTTYQTYYSDQSTYSNQVVLTQPPIFRNRLAWVPAQTVLDPVTGAAVYQPAGLHWVPRYRAETQTVYHPNFVPQTVAQTNYVTRMVPQEVPVQVTTYQQEQVCERVPYQVCRMVPEQIVNKVPYVVRRPVTERVEQKIPYQVCRMVPEVTVHKIPVTTYRTVYEEKTESIPVRVCQMMPVKETVRVPYTVEKRVPVTYTCYTPRVVCYQVPLDACGMPIAAPVVSGYERPGTRPAQEPTPAPARKADAADRAPELPGNLPRPLSAGESSAESGKGAVLQERLSPVPDGTEKPKEDAKEKQPSGSKTSVYSPGKQA